MESRECLYLIRLFIESRVPSAIFDHVISPYFDLKHFMRLAYMTNNSVELTYLKSISNRMDFFYKSRDIAAELHNSLAYERWLVSRLVELGGAKAKYMQSNLDLDAACVQKIVENIKKYNKYKTMQSRHNHFVTKVNRRMNKKINKLNKKRAHHYHRA